MQQQAAVDHLTEAAMGGNSSVFFLKQSIGDFNHGDFCTFLGQVAHQAPCPVEDFMDRLR